MSVKDQVLQAIHRLPDDIDYRDVADEISFLAAVREAERDIDEGQLVANEQMRARIADEIQRLWTVEALRRLDEVRSGRVQPVSGEEVLAEVRRVVEK